MSKHLSNFQNESGITIKIRALSKGFTENTLKMKALEAYFLVLSTLRMRDLSIYKPGLLQGTLCYATQSQLGGGMKKLTHKQKLFCLEYLSDFNGKRSALAAGYSKNSAQVIASENLCKPMVRKYLQELIDKRADKCEVSAERVVNELARHAFDDSEKIKLSDKIKALELLAKHLNLFKQIPEQDEGGGFQLIILGDKTAPVQGQRGA